MEQRIPFPLRGLNEDLPEGDQAPLTTRDCLNVRATDPRSGRDRGAQRSGLENFSTGPAFRNYLSQTRDLNVAPWVSLNQLDLVDDGDGETWIVTGENTGSVISALYQDIDASAVDLQVARTLTFSVEMQRSTTYVSRLIASVRIGAAGSGLGENNILRVAWNSGPSTTFTQGTAGATGALDALDDDWYRLRITLPYTPGVSVNGLRFEVQPENQIGNSGAVRVRRPQIEIGTFTGFSHNDKTLTLLRDRVVQHLTAFTYKAKSLTYSEQPPVTDWATLTTSKDDSYGIQKDTYGNVYVIDGASAVVKLNGSGKQVWRISVPLQDANSQLSTIHVDEFRFVYVGEAGGDETLGQLRKYSQKPFDETLDDPEDRTTLEWVIDLEGRVREIQRREELLLVLVDNDRLRQSVIVAYGGLETTEPYEAWVREVVYPSNALTVARDGSIFTTHEPDDERGVPGEGPALGNSKSGSTLVSWTPNDLSAAEKGAIYAWFKAEDLLPTHEDGDPVTEWFDTDGRKPSLFAPRDGGTLLFDEALAPRFVRYGIGGKPAVRFSGGQYLISGPNGTADSFGSSLAGTTILPIYEDACFVFCGVIRLLSVTDQGTILAHNSNSLDYAWTHNKRVGTTTTNGETFAIWTRTEAANEGNSGIGAGGTGGGDYPGDYVSAFAFNAQANVISVVHGGTSSNTGQPSMWRWAGHTQDIWEALNAFDATEEVYLGTGQFLNTDHGNGEFEISEFIVFQKQDPSSSSSVCIQIPTAFDPDAGSPNTSATDTSLEKVEGYLAWKYGTHEQMNGNSASFPVHPYDDTCPVSPDAQVDPNPLLSLGSLLVKYGPQGTLKWILSNYNGMGYDAVAYENFVYCMGPYNDAANTNGVPASARKIVDKGSSGSVLLAEGAWAYNGIALSDITDTRPKSTVDSNGNYYIPMNDGTARDYTVRVLAADKTFIHDYESSDDPLDVQNCRQVVVSTDTVDYEGDPVTLPMKFWVAMEEGAPSDINGDLAQVAQVSQVLATPNGRAQRGVQVISVVGGIVSEEYEVARTIPGAELSTTAEYVDSCFVNGELVLLDGDSYLCYKPRTGILGPLEAEGAGEIPDGYKLCVNYRGRLFLANNRDDGAVWAASKRGNIRNWDFVPAVPTVDQATSATVSRAGKCPDIINALVPYSDDILLIGGDHSIWLLRGDPEQAGDWDMVSDSTGMAFGRPWCKDPSGVLYFFGSRGVVYAYRPGGLPEPLSDRSIDRRLRAIDLVGHRIEMQWNTEDRGFHVFVLPRVAGGSIVESYFWSQEQRAWWPDSFLGDRQPLGSCVVDGDAPDDRRVLIIGEDRWIRGLSQDALDDAGQAIQSHVLIGPMMPPGTAEYRYTGFQATLADAQGGCRASWHLSDRPDLVGSPVFIQELSSGRNPRTHSRFRGSYLWLRLDSGDSDYWAYESAFANVYRAGRGRAYQ